MMADDVTNISERTSTAKDETTGSSRPEGREAVSEEKFVALEASIKKAFGKDLIEFEVNYGDVVIRVTKAGYSKAPKIFRDELDCDFLSFIAGMDWLPRPDDSLDGNGDPSHPPQPKEQSVGVCGGETRFQIFAHVQSTYKHYGITIKVDVGDDPEDKENFSVASFTDVYQGADWHERETWEMYGIDFIGHPEIRHLYLPGEFEGYPLRKDFPLLARVVKPWPGLVDVEPMLENQKSEAKDGK